MCTVVSIGFAMQARGGGELNSVVVLVEMSDAVYEGPKMYPGGVEFDLVYGVHTIAVRNYRGIYRPITDS
jgi:hypothetical protein